MITLPTKVPMTDRIPLTHATSTIIRCGCGSIDRVEQKDLIENGYTCAGCGRVIPARGDVYAREGRKVRRRMSGLSRKGKKVLK